MHRLTIRSLTLVVFETVLIVAAVAAAAYIRLGDWAWVILVQENGAAKTLLAAGVAQACLYYADLYDLRIAADRPELFVRIVQALGAASFILAVIYFWFPALIIGRGVFVIAAFLVITFVITWRLAFVWMSGYMGPRERLLLVGTSPAAVSLARELHEHRHELGVEIVGFVDADPRLVGTPVVNPGVIGLIDDIPSIVRDKSVDRVVVSLSDARGKLPMEKLLEMKLNGVTFDHLASVYEEFMGKIAVENLRPSWLIFSSGFRKSRIHAASKRAVDLVVSSLALALGLPIMAAIALAVRLTSNGPVHLSPAARRPPRPHLRRAQVPDDADGRGGDDRPRLGVEGGRHARHLDRPVAQAGAAGRAAAVLERSERRDEPRRTSPGASRVRRGPHPAHSVLRPAARRPAGNHRLGTSALYLRREHRGRAAEAAVRPLLHQELVDRARRLHHLRHDQDGHPAKGRLTVAAVVHASAGDVVNAMSVDVEDYFHVNAFDGVVPRDRWENLESRVTRNTERLLGLFEAGGVTATFFVLGWVAERFPSLVAAIAKQGHEVASHGYAHRLIYNQTREAFRDDVRRAKDLLESATGVHVDGFRAPSYSVTEQTLWALDVLIEEGYRYDASIFPIRHDRYGMPSSPRHPHVLTRDGGSLVEAPASTVRWAGMNLPVAGGGYFRILSVCVDAVGHQPDQPA